MSIQYARRAVHTHLVFQASWAALTFSLAVTALKGGSGGLVVAGCDIILNQISVVGSALSSVEAMQWELIQTRDYIYIYIYIYAIAVIPLFKSCVRPDDDEAQ